MAIEVGDIVTLSYVPIDAVDRSGGVILNYLGHACLVEATNDDPTKGTVGLHRIGFRNGMAFWVTAAMLRK
jgi:hypothetical protein